MDNKKTNIELTDEEINLILAALGQLPYVKVKSLIDNIFMQYSEINKTSENKKDE